MKINPKKSVLVVCANGGHLAEMRLVCEKIKQTKVWATFKGKDSKDLDGFKFIDRHNRFYKIISILLYAPLIILKVKPCCMLSTGGIISIPFAIFSKLFGIKIIYFECGTKLKTKSGTGKIMYYLANHFIVQSPDLLSVYGKKAQFVGRLL